MEKFFEIIKTFLMPFEKGLRFLCGCQIWILFFLRSVKGKSTKKSRNARKRFFPGERRKIRNCTEEEENNSEFGNNLTKNTKSTLTNVNGVNVILNSDLDHLFCEKCFREHFLICAKIQKLTLFTKKQSSSEPILVEQTYVRFTQKNVSSFHF